MRFFIPLLNVVELAIAIVKQKRKVLITVSVSIYNTVTKFLVV